MRGGAIECSGGWRRADNALSRPCPPPVAASLRTARAAAAARLQAADALRRHVGRGADPGPGRVQRVHLRAPGAPVRRAGGSRRRAVPQSPAQSCFARGIGPRTVRERREAGGAMRRALLVEDGGRGGGKTRGDRGKTACRTASLACVCRDYMGWSELVDAWDSGALPWGGGGGPAVGRGWD